MTDAKLKALAERDILRRAADISRRFHATRAELAETFREAERAGYDRATICIELAKRRDERIAEGTYKPGPNCVYFCRVVGHDLIKVGVTNNLKSRIAMLAKQIGFPLDLLGTINGENGTYQAISPDVCGRAAKLLQNSTPNEEARFEPDVAKAPDPIPGSGSAI